jgi:hypothetical protein
MSGTAENLKYRSLFGNSKFVRVTLIWSVEKQGMKGRTTGSTQYPAVGFREQGSETSGTPGTRNLSKR